MLDAEGYAAKWIRHTERDEAGQFADRFERWVQHYDAQGIVAVSGGLIAMRRRSGGANWLRIEEGPDRSLGPTGDSIELGFALRDFLESCQTDAQWMDQRLRLSPDARLRQQFEPGEEGWRLTETELRMARGLAYTGGADPVVAQLIGQCDGQRPLGTLLSDLAASLDQDASVLASACIGVVRRLVERGFLIPPTLPPRSPSPAE